MTGIVELIGAFLFALAIVVIVVPDSPYNQKTVYTVALCLLVMGMVLML